MTTATSKRCECGCGSDTKLAPQTASREGWVRGQPIRFINGHHFKILLRRRVPSINRIWRRIEKSKRLKGCWKWTGGKSNTGYALFWTEADGRMKTVLAHRWLYEQLIGKVPDGLTLDHLCRNLACVNPSHLEPVTLKENLARGREMR